MCYPAAWGADGMEAALAKLCADAEDAVREGHQHHHPHRPRRLGATHRHPRAARHGDVHHHLVRAGLRTRTGLVVETGSAREVHHFALPRGLRRRGDPPEPRLRHARRPRATASPQKVDEKEVVKRYIKAICKGLLKVMSKMGISTYQSYCGAQIFEAVGLSTAFVDKYFTGTPQRGRGHRARARSPRRRCACTASPTATRRSTATSSTPAATTPIAPAARRTCGRRTRSPSSSTRRARAAIPTYKEYAQLINEQSEKLLTLRGLFTIKEAADARADRGGRAREGDREALRHRRDVAGLDLARGALHARHRDEPHRRQVQHRRGRRGSDPLRPARQRRLDALGDQAGRRRPLRRDRPSTW